MFVTELAKSAIQENGDLLIRGTKEWDEREAERVIHGHCYCISYGSVEKAIETNGLSSYRRKSEIFFGDVYLPKVPSLIM